MKEAYQKTQGFYDTLAAIVNREAYKRDLLARIEAVPNWEAHHLLADFHKRVQTGGILTTAQIEQIERAEKASQSVDKQYDKWGGQEKLLERLRLLYRAASRVKDEWLVEFVTSVGKQVKSGRPLSDKQQVIVNRNLDQYQV